MRTPPTSDANKRQLQLLVAGGTEKNLADLREVCASANDGHVHLEHAADPEDVLSLIEKGSYDLLLCSGNSTDDAVFQLLRQVRQHDSRIPLIFLGNQTSEAVINIVIQSGTCRHSAKNSQPEPCKRQLDLQAQKMETIGRQLAPDHRRLRRTHARLIDCERSAAAQRGRNYDGVATGG